MQRLRFPERDLTERHTRAYSEVYGAIVCRRGHTVKALVGPDDPVDPDQKCAGCGAAVLVGCVYCGTRIRGGGLIGRYTPPGFCDECGAAHPWATREQRIYELENILDQTEIDEVDRLFIHEQLAALRALDGSNVKAEEAIWRKIAPRAKALLENKAAQSIIGGIVTAGVKQLLGL